MVVSKNTVVTLHYKLQEGDAQGELIEETFGGDPLVFLCGVGQMIPEFERQLAGKQIGEGFSFGIKSEDAYGDYDPEAMAPIPLSAFIRDGELMEELLEEGNTIPLRDQDGNQLLGTVVSVNEQEVLLDFNHPMAGVDLYFTGIIRDVRMATPSEIAHGHAHGSDEEHD
jgi:FKBP-type peptidyl-prolyl cis-trans isomerase SlyD